MGFDDPAGAVTMTAGRALAQNGLADRAAFSNSDGRKRFSEMIASEDGFEIAGPFAQFARAIAFGFARIELALQCGHLLETG